MITLTENDPIVSCDGCGEYYYLHEMWYCKDTGNVLCPKCRWKYEQKKSEYQTKTINQDNIFEDIPQSELTRCDGCGELFHKYELKKCHDCGIILCKSCQKNHNCHETHKDSRIPYIKQKKHHDKILIPAWAIILCVLFIVVGGGIGLFVLLGSSLGDNSSVNSTTDYNYSTQPHIVSSSGNTGTIPVTYNLEFYDDDNNYHKELISLSIDSSIYYGAKSDKSHKIKDADTFWGTMAADSKQDKMYNDIVSQLKDIISKYNMDSNRFVDLATIFVQNIYYDDYAKDFPRYPVETIVDKKGDCDEKSMLLAGILSKAGFDVALLVFDNAYDSNSGHMTVGIKTYTLGIIVNISSDTDNYSIIETTNPGWNVGDYSISYPTIFSHSIPIGNGALYYVIDNSWMMHVSAPGY